MFTATHEPEGTTGHITHLRVPFCLAFARTPPSFRDGKLSPQAEKCVHLGYSRTKPGYVLEVIEGPRKGRIITASQVKFREDVFPLKGDEPTPSTQLWQDVPEDDDQNNDDDYYDDYSGTPGWNDGSEVDEDDEDDGYQDPAPAVNDDEDSAGDDGDNTDPAPARRHTRARPINDVSDWRKVVNQLDTLGTAVLLTPTLDSVKKNPDDPKWAPRHYSQIKNIEDRELRNKWYRAHFAENDGLFDHPEVLEAIPLPPGVSDADLVHLMTLYVVKADGRLKARTVLGCGKGVLEELDLGIDRTFSPTARASTFRLLCAITAVLDLTIRGGDVRQAYLNGDWPEYLKKVLGHMPHGYNKYYNGKKYCVRVGNLYGNPVAGRNWYKRFVRWATGKGYRQSQHDPCLFTMTRGTERLYILIYVDDILTFSTKGSTLSSEFEEAFGEEFDWTAFGEDLHEFVSTRITVTKGKVELDMARYIESCVDDAFPGGVHHSYSCPADTDLAGVVLKAALAKDTTYAKTDIAKRFRRLVMQLLYLSQQTRPDIAIAVSLLTRVQAWPSPDLLKRAERVLIYAYGTKDLKLTYTAPESNTTVLTWAPHVTIEGASDADFSMAHSTSGYLLSFANSAAFSWGVKKQEAIALSTYEAEVVAGSLAACDIVSIRGILADDLGFAQHDATVLNMDTSSGINLAHDPMYHSTAKHIARRDLFIRELVEKDIVKPKLIPTAKNTADILTKPLPKAAFTMHRATILGLA